MSRISTSICLKDPESDFFILGELVAGWDNALQIFFATIFFPGGDEPLWDSIHELDGLSMTDLQVLKNRLLKKQNVLLPSQFWDKVASKDGNVVFKFDTSYAQLESI